MYLILALLAVAPTFNKDVAPILYKNCVTCHRPGEVAPFSLLTYSEAKRWAPMIAQATAAHIMPPWKAEAGFGDFADARVLTEIQIATLKAWAASGTLEGDAKDKTAPPKFPDGWKLGPPDMIIEMPTSYDVPAEGPDVMRCFSIPLDLKEEMAIAAVEVRPGNRRVLHHTVIFLDPMHQARALAAADPTNSYSCYGGPGVATTGLMAGWAPGNETKRLPDGLAVVVAKGVDLVVQNHYHPDGKPESDKTSIDVYFQKGEVKKQLFGLPLLQARLRIPAGENQYRTSMSYTTPIAVELAGLMPHMHYLGREMKVTATLPSGEVKPLVWIKDWDFNWQLLYGFKEPMLLPAGTKFDLEAVYDNSEGNPKNPSKPPKEVRFGEMTTDEMCVAMMVFYTPHPADQMVMGMALVQQLKLKMSDLFPSRRSSTP